MFLSLWRQRRRVMAAALALTLFFAIAACQPGYQASAGQQPTTTTDTSGGAGHNHVPAGSRPQWVRVTFTPSTSYTQARALISSVGTVPYPWACNPLYDQTPTPIAGQVHVRPVTTPPPSSLQDTPEVFAVTHQFILQYPRPTYLDQLAASSLVVSLDVVNLPHCTV